MVHLLCKPERGISAMIGQKVTIGDVEELIIVSINCNLVEQ